MTKEQALGSCRAFNTANATISLWVFKKRPENRFSAKSIEITEPLENELKRIVAATIEARTEVDDYSLITQCNEVSCLHVGADETTFADLKALVNLPAEERRISSERDLKNVSGYLIRLKHNEQALYCVKQVPDTWKTKKARSVVNVVFRENQLDLVEDRSFTIAKTLDFFVLGNDLFAINKRAFEMLLSYKIEYANSFDQLQQDAVFSGKFTSMQPLIDHVGTNTMHLRRMEIIRQRGHYADQAYMDRLREVNAQEGWNINFDVGGRIVATEDTMKVVMQVLLNHRLYSRLSLTTFDVPSSSAIQ